MGIREHAFLVIASKRFLFKINHISIMTINNATKINVSLNLLICVIKFLSSYCSVFSLKDLKLKLILNFPMPQNINFQLKSGPSLPPLLVESPILILVSFRD